MTEEQRELIVRLLIARATIPGRPPSTDDPAEILRELNDSLGFDVVARPDRVAELLRSAILSGDSAEVEHVMYLAGFVGFHREFLPPLLELLGLGWHRNHEDIAAWFQSLKAPEAVEALYSAALAPRTHMKAGDDYYALARRCTWALADIGTPEAYQKLQLLAECDVPEIAAHAQKRIDRWQEEVPRKGLRS
jgi:hypothetical protein